jgi:hypothetical protein
MTKPSTTTCLACGVELSPSLERSGSLRCHDCRDVDAPLRSDLVGQPERRRRISRRRLRQAA